jgi:hypothetical protein
MKYISPGGWFSLEYPMGWHEFEDTEESFLFYNLTGGQVISAYRLIRMKQLTMVRSASHTN